MKTHLISHIFVFAPSATNQLTYSFTKPLQERNPNGNQIYLIVQGNDDRHEN